jgi:UDP-glucose 4-epimerase
MRRYNYVNNLVSWANVANAAVTHGTRRVVVCSSMAVYGAQRPPFVESMTPQPIDPYGAAKAAMEVDVRALGQIHGTEWVIVRPHNVYGPRQNMADGYRNVAAIFMRQALTDTDVTVYGDGTQVRSLSYIDDVAAAISHIALGPRHGYVVNVGGEQPVPIRRLAEMVVEVSGSRSRIVHLPARHEVHTAFCDHDTLRSVVGVWRPIRLEDGLDRFAKWATDLEVAPLRSYDYEVTANLFAPWRPR